ncbi:MAG: ribonuclease Z [Candidatus Lokiarchaeota archaeon]|nr:ribonuclease Z [Candidatus Lokiarchaeota archaeon]
MNLELIILGSSGAIPVKDRNLPGISIRYNSEIILFDCGEDIQRRFQQAGLKFNIPLTIFISHMHGDHVIGLPGLLFNFSLKDRDAPVKIYGPPSIFLYLFLHKKILGLYAPYDLEVNEIDLKNSKITRYKGLQSEIKKEEINIIDNILFETRRYMIKSTIVEHSVLTYAFSFVEKPRFGKFNPERAKELNIPEGYLWKKLHNGEEIKFKGKIINPEKEGIVGPKKPGRKITYSADTTPCESLIELGKNSDILIHEATYDKSLNDVAKEKKHSTTIDAAEMAKKMNVKQLILFHFSSRYNNDKSIELLINEAKEIFENTIAAYDLLRIELK